MEAQTAGAGKLSRARRLSRALTAHEWRIVVVDQDDVDRAVVAAHTAFGLDSTEEAVVYAGTGR